MIARRLKSFFAEIIAKVVIILRKMGPFHEDIRLYIDKLHSDAADCLTISQTANSDAKRKVFSARKLAAELEKIAAANAVLDEKRDKHLLGLLGGGAIRPRA